MTRVPDVVSAEPESAGDHVRLLRDAAERSPVLARVMRLVVQEIWSGLAASGGTGSGESAEPSRGGTRGFGKAQYHVLHLLAPLGSLTVGEIADRCHVSAPTISKMLNSLESQGLIERQLDRSNRRVVRVVLTDAGRAAQARMELRIKAAFERLLSPLTVSQLRDVIAACDHLQRLVDDESSTT